MQMGRVCPVRTARIAVSAAWLNPAPRPSLKIGNEINGFPRLLVKTPPIRRGAQRAMTLPVRIVSASTASTSALPSPAAAKASAGSFLSILANASEAPAANSTMVNWKDAQPQSRGDASSGDGSAGDTDSTNTYVSRLAGAPLQTLAASLSARMASGSAFGPKTALLNPRSNSAQASPVPDRQTASHSNSSSASSAASNPAAIQASTGSDNAQQITPSVPPALDPAIALKANSVAGDGAMPSKDAATSIGAIANEDGADNAASNGPQSASAIAEKIQNESGQKVPDGSLTEPASQAANAASAEQTKTSVVPREISKVIEGAVHFGAPATPVEAASASANAAPSKQALASSPSPSNSTQKANVNAPAAANTVQSNSGIAASKSSETSAVSSVATTSSSNSGSNHSSDGSNQSPAQAQHADLSQSNVAGPMQGTSQSMGSQNILQIQTQVAPTPAGTTDPTGSHPLSSGGDAAARTTPQPDASTTLHGDGSDAVAASGINTAKLLQTVGESEMRVGMHSAEFGDISIRTSIVQKQMVTEISLDHGALSQAISAHVSGVQSKLGDEFGLHSSIEVRNLGSSFSGNTGPGNTNSGDAGSAHGSADSGQSSQRQPRGISSSPVVNVHAANSEETGAGLAAFTAARSQNRLDIRA